MKREIKSILEGNVDPYILELALQIYDEKMEEIRNLKRLLATAKATKRPMTPREDRRQVVQVLSTVRNNETSHVYFNPELRSFTVRSNRFSNLDDYELVGVYTKPLDNNLIREDLWYELNDVKATDVP